MSDAGAPDPFAGADILTKLDCGTRAAAVACAVARDEVEAQGVST